MKENNILDLKYLTALFNLYAYFFNKDNTIINYSSHYVLKRDLVQVRLKNLKSRFLETQIWP